MSDIKISLDSSGPAGKVSVVRVDGVIDTITAPELEKVMNSLLEQKKYNIVVDLGGVDYISSAGWGIFISNIREIRQNSGDIKLARMIPNVYEIFELLEFDSILKAFDSVEKAKSDFHDGADNVVENPVGQASDISASESPGFEDSSPRPIDLKDAIPTGTAVAEKERIAAEPVQKISPPDLRQLVVEMVSKDPFFTISEIKREVGRKHPSLKPGWWKIWGILRRNGLLTKKSRFRRARTKLGQGNE
ncbi:MAG: STAS domain-containing protein [Candidatus Zixiibacteriota bacterium]|nr:MAG: STAS domain-containing protein [candidate division Zixibacteria bacterium]